MRLVSAFFGSFGVWAAPLLLVSPRASAADSAAQARVLFKEGRALAAAGKYDEACPKFEASRDLDPGVGTAFNLADCWEHTGRLESARALFVHVADVTHALGQGARERQARARAAALEARLPRVVVVTVEVPPQGQSAPLPRETAPLDSPSSHLPRRAPRETRLTAIPSRPAAEPRLAPEPGETGRTSRYIGYGLVATAGVGALLAGVSYGVYAKKNGGAKDVCGAGERCTEDDIARHDDLLGDARTARTVSCVGLSVALTSAVAAGAVFATRAYWRGRRTEAPGWTPSVAASPGFASVSLTRTF